MSLRHLCAASVLITMLFSTGSARAAATAAKPHADVVEEVVAFLMSDVGYDGILTMDGVPGGAPVPPYFYHYAIRHTDRLRSNVTGYPGYASISYPAYTMSIAIDAFLAWWAYSGDPQGLARAVECADWLVDRRTPAADLYANWPYSTQTDGVMGGGYDEDAVMSDKPAMFALRCLRLFDVTQDPRYWDAAVEIADTYVATQATGGPEEDGRWPFRVRPSDGLVRQDYTSHLVPAILLLERLESRRPGFGYGGAAARAWSWIFANPLDPASASYMRWEGFYEDIGPESAGLRDHYGAEATATALLARGLPGDVERAIEIRDWSTDRYLAADGIQNGHGMYHPSLLEWDAWLNTTYAATAQWAVLHLRLDRATAGTALHDPGWQTLALEALHTLTYGQAPASSVPTDDGRMLTTVRELTQPSFGIETWYEQNFNTVLYLLEAFDLEPSLAPADENHLLGFDAAELRSILVSPARIETAWASAGTARWKMAARPRSVQIGGEWIGSPGAGQHGSWTWEPGSQILTVVHDGSGVVIEPSAATTVPPERTALTLRAWPNPFNPRVQLAWTSPAGGAASLTILDLRGRIVARLPIAGPSGSAVWDGTDQRGREVASGSYRAVLEVMDARVSRAITLTR